MRAATDLPDAVPAGELVAQQVGAIARLTPVMMAANLVNLTALLFALALTHTVAAATVVWAALVAAYAVSMLGLHHARRGRRFPTSLGPRTQRRLVLYAALLGGLWAYPGLAIMPTAPPLAQAFIIALCAGMMAGGAITLYPVPAAALSYCTILVGAHLAGFARTGEPVFTAFAVVAAMFLVTIWWSVVRHRAVFVSEFAARRALAARNETIAGLLEETRSEASRERREAEARLAQVQRLDAVGRLTAGIAHDFNNLLAAIMGNVELAQIEADDGERRGLLDAALDATRRGADLTQQLLAFGRRANLRPEPTDPGDALRSLRALVERTLPATIALRVDVATGGRRLHVDPSQLGNALLNLVINARDAMPGGGVMTLSAYDMTVGPGDAAAWGADGVAPGEYVGLAVSDTGPGVAPEALAHVFEPFFSTKGVGEGSGLGLAMVYGFARQSGGRAAIESRPGRGTTVTVLLPALPSGDGAAPAPMSEGMAAPAPASAPLRVLLVEDVDEVRRVVAGQLRVLGHDAIAVADGTTALGMLRSGTRVDLLLTDLVMPGPVQGPALARRALAEGLVPAAVLMSGNPEAAGDGGAAGLPVLQKPVSMAALAEAVARATR